MFNAVYLVVLNWFGNIAFCLCGILAARKFKQKFPIQFLSGLLVTFGGGFWLRDIAVLRTKPTILSSPREIAIVCFFAMLMWIAFNGNDKRAEGGKGTKPWISAALNKAFVLLDSYGILAFAIIGHDRGLAIDGTYPVAVICGFFTACGGGILASLLRHLALTKKPLSERLKLFGRFLKRSRPYYAYGFTIVLTYSVLTYLGVEKRLVVLIQTPITLILGFLADYEINRG